MTSQKPIEWLLTQYEELKLRRPQYTMRAFARDLGISPSILSEVLSGRRRLTERTLLIICQALQVDPLKTQKLLTGLDTHQESDGNKLGTESWEFIDAEGFKRIADWYHNGIFALASLANIPDDPEYVATRLNIEIPQAIDAIARMKKFGLIEAHEGILRTTKTSITAGGTGPNFAVREHHHQFLELAQADLKKGIKNCKEFSTMTMAIDPAKLDDARQLIKEFRRGICKLLEGPGATQVYMLGIQMIRVDDDEHYTTA